MSSESIRPLLLVSNDDGHTSYFLRALVEALYTRYDVCVVAPSEEQSWVGRAMTRSGPLEARELEGWPCEAWSVSGRPSDCVNIGLNHLITRRPAAVISGMNLGFNVSLPLTLSSGTVAAATEGALAGLPAIAFSLAIAHHDFMTVSGARGHRDPEGDAITHRAARRALAFTESILSADPIPYSVHNVNFPADFAEDAPIIETELTLSRMPSLFKPISQPPEDQSEEQSEEQSGESSDHLRRYTFSFASEWEHTHNPLSADLNTIRRGEISHTLLRWDSISAPPSQ